MGSFLLFTKNWSRSLHSASRTSTKVLDRARSESQIFLAKTSLRYHNKIWSRANVRKHINFSFQYLHVRRQKSTSNNNVDDKTKTLGDGQRRLGRDVKVKRPSFRWRTSWLESQPPFSLLFCCRHRRQQRLRRLTATTVTTTTVRYR